MIGTWCVLCSERGCQVSYVREQEYFFVVTEKTSLQLSISSRDRRWGSWRWTLCEFRVPLDASSEFLRYGSIWYIWYWVYHHKKKRSIFVPWYETPDIPSHHITPTTSPSLCFILHLLLLLYTSGECICTCMV